MTTVTIPEKVGVAAGFTFDLSRTWIDVYGTRWEWTGTTDSTGQALMRHGGGTPERLSHVYWTFGPLIAAPRPVTVAEQRAVLTAPACTSQAEEPKPVPTPRTLFGALGRRRGRRS